MATNLTTVPIVDADSHVAEPTDLWTSRMPRRFADDAPSVVWDDTSEAWRWKVGDVLLSEVGEYCTAGWPETFPSHPPTLDEAFAATYDPRARLTAMDEWGVAAQVLYPNVIGFDSHAFISELGPEAATACVQAYNDFLAEFAQVDRRRFVPIMMLPFWDVEASIREMHRAQELGHKGILFAALLERIGYPNISDPQWTPLLAAAEEMGLPINFHIGFSLRTKESSEKGWSRLTTKALSQRLNRISFVRSGASGIAPPVEAVADVILKGVAIRHPNLRFVSVETGFGHWPHVMENMDWVWQSSGAAEEYPERDLPSEYWRRQFTCTFTHEKASVCMLPDYRDNVMFSTDFPHEASLMPGLHVAKNARDTIVENLASLPDDVVEQVVHGNAVRLYGLES